MSKQNNNNEFDIEFIEYNMVEEEEKVEVYHSLEEMGLEPEDIGEGVNVKKEIISWIVMFITAIGIAYIISNFILINAYVPTGSMENTIPKKSRLIGLRLAYNFSEPERGDIIIFKNPNNPNENYVKRIIGLPGERVVLRNSEIYIYGADGSLKHGPLNEPYLQDKIWMSEGEEYVFNIPKDRYLVLGDNRNNSADARTWYRNKGDVEDVYIHKDKILAQGLFIYWSKFQIFDDIEYK